MKRMERNDLKNMMDRHEDFALVEVLGADQYRKFHLPGAINVPGGEHFAENIRAAVPDKQKPVVVYEAGTAPGDVCAAAKSAARVLIGRGYKAVVYQEGLKDWEKSGGAVER